MATKVYKIDTDTLRKADETLKKVSVEEATMALGEWATTGFSLPDYSWATTTGGTSVAYDKETESQEIVDLETKIEDAIDNIVMLIKAARPHDEESLRDRIRCGIEEAFSVEKTGELKPIKTVTFHRTAIGEPSSTVSPSFTFAADTVPVIEGVSCTCGDYSTVSGSTSITPEGLASAITKEYEKVYTDSALKKAFIEESFFKEKSK